MTKGAIEKVALAVQVDGKGYYVALPQDRLIMLVKMADSLTDSGKLTLQPMPPGHGLTPMEPAPVFTGKIAP